jgi:hypothetical protein
MADDRGVIREVAWRDIFPWLIIFRTFRLAKSMPLLFVATLGVVLAPAGWRVGEALFVSEAELQADFEFAAFVEHQCRWPGQQSGLAPPNHGRVPRSIRDIVFTSPNTLEPIYFRFVDPVARLLNSRLTVTQAAYCAFGSLWTLVVWGFLAASSRASPWSTWGARSRWDWVQPSGTRHPDSALMSDRRCFRSSEWSWWPCRSVAWGCWRVAMSAC